jgi:hypothetical protein
VVEVDLEELEEMLIQQVLLILVELEETVQLTP